MNCELGFVIYVSEGVQINLYTGYGKRILRRSFSHRVKEERRNTKSYIADRIPGQ